MTQQLLPIVISAGALALFAFAIALCRSSARAEERSARLEAVALARRRNHCDEQVSSSTVWRLSPQPPTSERLTSTSRSRRHT
jgi:hypothetical protein